MFDTLTTIDEFDADLANAMRQEALRQEAHIELITSENYATLRTWQREAQY